MNGWMRSGWFACLALGLGLAAFACGSKEDGKSDSSAKATGSTAAPTSVAAATSAAAETKTAEAKVDVDALLADDGKDEGEGMLKVDLSGVDDKAPTLGDAEPPPQAAGPKIEWLPAGNILIMNPGWEKKKEENLAMLLAPDKKAVVLFTPFTTVQDGGNKVNAIVKLLKLKSAKWKPAKVVKLGPDKIPARMGIGSAVGGDGKPAKLFYAMMMPGGGGTNVLAIGGADGDAPPDDLKLGMGSVLYAKRKK
jgi:hypothetical protein